jgi:drug/metabolite transporter (DMT)-like permease
VIAKAATGNVDPVVLTFLRSLVATSGLLVLLYIRGHKIHIRREDYKRFMLLGIISIPMNQFFYLYGVKFSTAANGALLFASTPTFVLIASAIMGLEKITKKKFLGVAIAFIGVMIVVFERGVDLSSDFAVGNLFMLGSVFAWVIYTLAGKSLIIQYGALRTTAVVAFIGAILFFPFGILKSLSYDFTQMTLGDIGGVIYLGLGTSIISYFLWYYALGKIDATKVAVFANGQPIVATILSILFLDYSITTTFVIGGCITLLGVVTTQLASRKII